MLSLLSMMSSQPVPATNPPLIESHSIEAIVVGFIVGAGKIWDLLKGRRRDLASSESLRRIEQTLHQARLEMRDLRAYVIGPDGRNGLRGDLQELREEVKGILERERDRLSVQELGTPHSPR